MVQCGCSIAQVQGVSENGQPPGASLIYMIGRVNQGIRRGLRERLSDFDLSVAEYTTLSVLAARPQLSNAQLARRALVTSQSMLEILAELERRGLVQRELDRDHARIMRARPTAKGHELIAAAEPAVQSVHDEIFAGLSERQQAAVLTAMHTAMTNLSRSARDSTERRRARSA